MRKIVIGISIFLLCIIPGYSQEEPAKKLPSDIKSLFDYSIRDVSIYVGPANNHLTGMNG
jgi:hypothetical protein